MNLKKVVVPLQGAVFLLSSLLEITITNSAQGGLWLRMLASLVQDSVNISINKKTLFFEVAKVASLKKKKKSFHKKKKNRVDPVSFHNLAVLTVPFIYETYLLLLLVPCFSNAWKSQVQLLCLTLM